jgi:GntR family transcriptional regulator / MocR family aminotransferase
MDLALTLPPGDRRGARLREALREAILSGRLSQGTRLPPTRALAAQLGVSRGTVVAVYEELVGDGYCVGRTGAGTYVAVSPTTDPPPERPAPRALSVWARALAADAPARQDDPGSVEYDFRYGVAPEGFPAAGRSSG